MLQKKWALWAILLFLTAAPLAAQENPVASAVDELRSFFVTVLGLTEDAAFEAEPANLYPMIPSDGSPSAQEAGAAEVAPMVPVDG